MSNNKNDIQEVELSIEDAKSNIRLAEALNRLRKNKDFQLLIEEAYFKDEAARAVSLVSDPEMQTETRQKVMQNLIVGIGQLQQFFNKVYRISEMSERSLEEYENEHQRLLSEGADE